MENPLQLVPFKDRRYEDIPIDKVKVINSRNRESGTVRHERREHRTRRPAETDPRQRQIPGPNRVYELICGEGRLLAHKRTETPRRSGPRWSPARARKPTCNR